MPYQEFELRRMPLGAGAGADRDTNGPGQRAAPPGILSPACQVGGRAVATPAHRNSSKPRALAESPARNPRRALGAFRIARQWPEAPLAKSEGALWPVMHCQMIKLARMWCQNTLSELPCPAHRRHSNVTGAAILDLVLTKAGRKSGLQWYCEVSSHRTYESHAHHSSTQGGFIVQSDLFQDTLKGPLTFTNKVYPQSGASPQRAAHHVVSVILEMFALTRSGVQEWFG